MSPANNTIFVNVRSGIADKSTISGTLNLTGNLLGSCEKVLHLYENGNASQARRDLKNLLSKHSKSKIVKRLYILILYRDMRYSEAYKAIQEMLKIVPHNAISLNMEGLIQRQLGLFECIPSALVGPISLIA